MSRGWEGIYIQCPYYRREDRQRMQIKCEGIVEGTDLYQRFGSLEKLRRQKKAFCQGEFWGCPVAMALDRKYGVAGREGAQGGCLLFGGEVC